jgi:WD40 repeat protein
MVEFNRSIAIVVGIDQYQNGIPPLKTAVADAHDISQVLRIDHGYQSGLLTNGQATLAVLRSLLTEKLPAYIQPDDRLLFYFAGHGLAFNGDEGPEGYLIPQDATLGKSDTYLPMTEVHDALTALPCRHFLGIFDCCFAGAFRWSATRDLSPVPEVIYRERYERFLTDPAWQVITSAADDQKALDALALTDHRGQVGQHSPFAQALIEALQANSVADASPPAKNGQPAGDGVITATELYQYLRDAIEPETIGKAQRQTPGLWPLNKHGKGEFIFLVPGRQPNLPDAPLLNADSNPYRGLEAFEEIHQNLFFGRQQLIKDLQTFVETHPSTVVLGASGTGKSSLVKAGLVPALKRILDISGQPLWQVLAVLRPGATPLKALVQALQVSSLGLTVTSDTPEALALAFTTSLEQWRQVNPQAKLLLVIDQAEELFSLCREPEQRQQFLQLLAQGQEPRSAWFHVVFTLRSDFEPQFRGMAVENLWSLDRFLIRPMNREELRAAIEGPASAKVIYFDPPNLVDRLIDEVNEMPGALPLLSFTLRELFLKYLRTASRRTSRAITVADYEELGGIKQALVNRADEEYQKLVTQDPAFADTIRHVMLRMVAIGGTGNTRRQVPLSELEYPGSEGNRVNQIITRFKEARLLVSDTNADNEPYVEPAHDALVEGWPRLLKWLESGAESLPTAPNTLKGKSRSLVSLVDEREILLLQRRLTPAANDWKLQGKKSQFLWHADARLPIIKQIHQADPSRFNQNETEFIQRSLDRKRFNVSFRWIAMTGLLATSAVVSLVILNARQQAEENRIEAERRNIINLAENSQSSFESEHFSEALISAVQAGRIVQSEARIREDSSLETLAMTTLFRAFYRTGFENKNRELYGLPGKTSAINTEANLIASIENNSTIKIWNIDSGNLILEKINDYQPLKIVLLPKNNYFATIGNLNSTSEENNDLSIDIWKVKDGERVPLENFISSDWLNTIHSLSPSAIESLLLAFDSGKNLDYLLSLLTSGELANLQKFSLHPSGAWIAGFTDTIVFLLNVESGNITTLSTLSERSPSPSLNNFDASDTDYLKEAEYLDETDENGFQVLNRNVVADDIAFGQDGKTVISVGDLAEVRKWNLDGDLVEVKKFDSQLCNTLRQAGASPNPYVLNNTVYLSPDGSILAIACINGTVKLWNINLAHDSEELDSHPVEINYFKDENRTGTFGGSFSNLLFDSNRSIIGIENVLNGREVTKFFHLDSEISAQPQSSDDAVYDFAYSPDGNNLALLKVDGTLSLQDSQSLEEISHFSVIEDNYLFFLGNYGDIGDGGLLGFRGRPRVAFSQSGKELAVSYGECKLQYDNQTRMPELIEPENSIIENTDGCWSSIIKIINLDGNHLNTLSYPGGIENIGFITQDKFLMVFGDFVPTGVFDFKKNEFSDEEQLFADIDFPFLYASSLSPDGKVMAIATGEDEFRQGELAASLQILNFETEESSYLPIDVFVNDLVDLSFSPNSEILTLGMSNNARVQAWDIQKLQPIVNEIEVNRADGSKLVSVSPHPSKSLFAVTTGQAQVGKTLTIDTQIVNSSGEVIIDFGNIPLEKVMFSHDGSRLSAIRLQNSGSGTTFDGFLTWEFELDRLLEKSCDYLQQYLSSPILSEENRATCDANLRSVASASRVNGNTKTMWDSFISWWRTLVKDSSIPKDP